MSLFQYMGTMSKASHVRRLFRDTGAVAVLFIILIFVLGWLDSRKTQRGFEYVSQWSGEVWLCSEDGVISATIGKYDALDVGVPSFNIYSRMAEETAQTVDSNDYKLCAIGISLCHSRFSSWTLGISNWLFLAFFVLLIILRLSVFPRKYINGFPVAFDGKVKGVAESL